MLVCMLNLKNAWSAKHCIWMGLAEQGKHSLICPSSLISAYWYQIAPTPLTSSTVPMNMQRRSCICTPGMTTDIFDGLHYCSLLGEHVVVRDQTLTHHYFSDHHDITLGFATDSFAPFKKWKHTVWILLIFNYNLPPDEHFQRDNILCVGIIPGPKKPWNADLFIHPLVQELLELAIGVPTYDALSSCCFALHAYLITAFGDIPTISIIMCIKGYNSLCPCWMCKIQGIRIPNLWNRMLYVLLSRHNHPEPTNVVEYHPERLLLRLHDSFMVQANAVESAPTEVQQEKLAKAYGIKGVPLLSALGSLRFPQSFPYDFMHLIWENLIPNLVLFWSGRYKGMDEGQPYVLNPDIWQVVGAISIEAMKTTPSLFGAAIPNPVKNCSYFTSSTWSVWSLFIAPTILQNCFPEEHYYKHFGSLVGILNLCLQFEISKKDINDIKLGICKWVVDYEQCIPPPLSFPKSWTLIQSTHPASTTSMTLNNSQRAHSQYMPSSTFLTKSDGWVHVGQHGLSPSRGNAGTSNAASRVDETCTWTWTDTLLTCRSSARSKFYTTLLMSSLESLPSIPLCKQRGLRIVSHILAPSP